MWRAMFDYGCSKPSFISEPLRYLVMVQSASFDAMDIGLPLSQLTQCFILHNELTAS